mgnify:FL=1
MTEEQKLLLEQIAEELGGKLTYWVCCDRTTEHQKIMIEYAHTKRQ